MYKPTKKEPGNVSQFKEYKCLVRMEKPKSPLSVCFFEDPEDDFLIHVVRFKTKSGVINYESMIIEPDLEKFIHSYERDEFAKV